MACTTNKTFTRWCIVWLSRKEFIRELICFQWNKIMNNDWHFFLLFACLFERWNLLLQKFDSLFTHDTFNIHTHTKPSNWIIEQFFPCILTKKKCFIYIFNVISYLWWFNRYLPEMNWIIFKILITISMDRWMNLEIIFDKHSHKCRCKHRHS